MNDGQPPTNFGAPFGGGGDGGGQGGPPPAQSPGGPLAHIPFSAVESRTIRLLANCMKIAGIAGVLNAIIAGMQGIVGASKMGTGVGIHIVIVLFSLSLNGLIAYWLLRSARSFGKMVDTDGADQDLLIDALSQLRNLFWLKAIFLLLGLLCGLCALFGLIAVGANFPVPNQ